MSKHAVLSMNLQKPITVFAVPERTAAAKGTPVSPHRYAWFSETNKHQFLSHLDGLQTVQQQQEFTHQIPLYQEKMVDLVEKDVAERTHALIQHATGYPSIVFHCTALNPEQRYFEAPTVQAQYVWVFHWAADFPGLIPPHALAVVAALATRNLQPDKYWVAEPYKVVKLVDPVLYAQFGLWFVSLAEWV